jgi:hypothetical protein
MIILELFNNHGILRIPWMAKAQEIDFLKKQLEAGKTNICLWKQYTTYVYLYIYKKNIMIYHDI